MGNNRTIHVHETAWDQIRQAKMDKERAKNYEEKGSALRDDIKALMNMINPGKQYILDSNIKIVGGKEHWNKNTPKGNITPITKGLLDLKNNFFNVIANKNQTGEELKNITIEKLKDIKFANQKGIANESLTSYTDAMNYYRNIVNKKGKIIAWDLETYGGKDLNGIWRPEGITEFSMQEYDFATNKRNKTTIMMGMTKNEKERLKKEIFQAIDDGSIDQNERLRVTAMRMAMYGEDSFKKSKTSEGYWVVDNFPTYDIHDWKNKDKIERGLQRHVDIMDDMLKDKDPVTGLTADRLKFVQTINQTNKELKNRTAMLLGYNDSIFDKAVVESFIEKESRYNPAFKDLFDGDAGLHVDSDQWMDLFGFTKLYSNYFSVGELYNGTDISDIEKIRGQEYLVQKHLAKRFIEQGYQPHKAEDDVSALLDLVTVASELGDGKQTYLDMLAEKLDTIQYESHNLKENKSVLRAKKSIMEDWGGRRYFNFATDSDGNVYTSDNHILTEKGIKKVNYKAGYGVNKGQLYDILSMDRITIDDELRSKIGDISPEYSGKQMYRLQLKIVTDTNGYSDMRVGDLTQNLFFNNEKEMQGFLAGNFNLVAERQENGEVKIIQGMEKFFDRRKVTTKNGKVHFEEIYKDLDDTQRFNMQVKENTEKLITSRAENYVYKDNAYQKISKLLGLEQDLKAELGQNINGKQLSYIMAQDTSKKVVDGGIVLPLNNSTETLHLGQNELTKVQRIIKRRIGRVDKNNRFVEPSKAAIDNSSVGIDMVLQHKKVLESIINEINTNEYSSGKSDEYKAELFNRVYKQIKMIAADDLYNTVLDNDKRISLQNKAILGDKKLATSFAELGNIFEVDYTKLIKGDKLIFDSVAKPSAYSNILKLDLTDEKAIYDLIKTSRKVIHGDKTGVEYDKDAVTKMFAMLNENKELSNTDEFKEIINKFGFKHGKFKEDINAYDVAERIINGMRSIKEKDATKGFVNKNGMFMKAIEGSTTFNEKINSKDILSRVSSIVSDTAKDFEYYSINSENDAKEMAKKLVSKYYMPDYNVVKNSKHYDETLDILYNNAKNDITDWVTSILYSTTHVDGTSISIQDNGDLLINRGDRIIPIDVVPKVTLDNATGVMDVHIGRMKMQLNNQLTFKKNYKKVEAGARSSIGVINDFNIEGIVKNAVNNDGENKGLDMIEYLAKRTIADLRQQSTINGYSGNDIDANKTVDISNIANIITDIFDENGDLYGIISDPETKFMDNDIIETMQKDLKRYISKDQKIEEFSPEQLRDLSKNFAGLLESIIRNGTVTNEFKYLATGLGFTGSEKKVSKGMAIKGKRPSNSLFGIFDNGQRPPVTQSGNAYHLRVSDLKDAEFMGIGIGNVLTSDEMEKRLTSDYAALGKTTTDVMMDVSYIGTDSLRTLFENNYNKVMAENNVDNNTRKKLIKSYQSVKNMVNTFEQERVIDSRAHEKIFGLKTANTQKLSKGSDIVEIIDDLHGKDYEEQWRAAIKQRGEIIKTRNGDFIYQPAVGKIVHRGDSPIKWKGFAGLETGFTSKIHKGVFNYNYYESDGTKLKLSEINKLINNNKSAFENANTSIERIAILDKIMKDNKIEGFYSIEDINAKGYAKTMTGAEKGMTHVLYASTGSYDDRVKTFFKEIGQWEEVKSTVLTNEAVDAYYYANKAQSKKALEKAGMKSLYDLKSALETERHTHSKTLFTNILEGRAHVIANDGIGKHGNTGQMYQGLLSKAISSLSKKYEKDKVILKEGQTYQSLAINEIVKMMNNNEEMQFINNVDLREGTINRKAISVELKNGKMNFGEMNTGDDLIAELDSDRFENLIKSIDEKLEGMDQSDRLVAHDVYVMNSDGHYVKQKEVIGSFELAEKVISGYESEDAYKKGKLQENIKAKIIQWSNTRENFKYVRDSETQSGVDAQYFKLKSDSLAMKKEQIKLKKAISQTKDKAEEKELKGRLFNINNELEEVEQQLRNYSDAVKLTNLGDQELSILGRISITDNHVKQVNDLILDDSTKLSADIFLNSQAFKDYVKKNEDGTLEFSKNVLNNKTLDRLISQLMGSQFYDSSAEIMLTGDMVKQTEYAHLKQYYDYAKKHGLNIGVDSAEKIHQYKLADKASKFNADPLGRGADSIIDGKNKNGYKRINIENVNFDTGELSTKNLLIDLGEEFDRDKRYIAMPGLGSMVGDEQIKLDAQNKLIGLQKQIENIRANAGGDEEKHIQLMSKALEKRKEVEESLNLSLYGKNGIFHTASKVETDAVTYRLKMSGVVADTTGLDQRMVDDLQKLGVTVEASTSYTNKSMIDGRTIADWEKDGMHFKYKYAAREQFEKAGYFEEDTLKKFGFLKDGVNKDDAIKEMEEFLKTHGTYDITDRYPNIKNESLGMFRMFLADDLANNQTKMSLAAVRSMNGDFDGDSATSFRIEYKDKNGNRFDGAMYERAKQLAQEAGEDTKSYVKRTNFMPIELFEDFEKIEQSMIINAGTDNQIWQKDAKSIILKDYIKNQNVSNPKNAVMLPGGTSILGKRAYSGLSFAPTMKEFERNEVEVNNILKQANSLISEKKLKTDLLPENIREGNSAELLDKALTIIEDHGGLDKKAFERMQVETIKRVNVDKYATEIMAKTGLAATGSVNVSMNAVKLASYYSKTDAKDIAFTNYVWAALDVAEQGVISSKKIDGKITYDDKRIKEFRKAMDDLFTNKTTKINSKADAVQDVTDWLEKYGDGVFASAYETMGDKILSEDQLRKLSSLAGDERKALGAKMMREKFASHIKDLSDDELFSSYFNSFQLMGRNGRTVGSRLENGSIGLAAADGESLTSRMQGIIGYDDEVALDARYKKLAQESLRQQNLENAREKLRDSGQSASENLQEMRSIIKGASNVADNITISSHSGGLGKVALGLAAGLLVSGYAAGNPLNDKSAQQHSEEQNQPKQEAMTIPQFMEQEGGYVTGNSQQGYVINISADTRKGRKRMEQMMKKAAEATVGGSVSVNMNIKNKKNNQTITDSDIENFLNKYI